MTTDPSPSSPAAPADATGATSVPRSARGASQAFVYLQQSIASMLALPPMREAKRARHDALIVLSVLDGSPFTLETENYSGTMNAAVIAPLTPLTLRADKTRTLNFSIHLVHPDFRTLRAWITSPVQALDRAAFAHLNADLLSASRGELSEDQAVRLIDEVLAVTLKGAPLAPPMDERVRWVMDELEEDPSASFERLATELGLSPSRLSHLFKQALGVSFRSYVTWGRLLLAWEMVALNPEMSFTQIAHLMGYSDSSHMARSFHTQLGITPTVMRDRNLIQLIGRPSPKGKHLPWSTNPATWIPLNQAPASTRGHKR